jgi:hypothetical protein
MMSSARAGGRLSVSVIASLARLKALLATRYVALGSSFAAGPRIATRAQASPRTAWRSTLTPHLLARRLNLNLVDVTYCGATTAELLEGQQPGQPAQVEAVPEHQHGLLLCSPTARTPLIKGHLGASGHVLNRRSPTSGCGSPQTLTTNHPTCPERSASASRSTAGGRAAPRVVADRVGEPLHHLVTSPRRDRSQANCSTSWKDCPPSWSLKGYTRISFGPAYAL